jgi:DNA-binding NtrC family response regulator
LADEPFVKINCAAIPDTLLESQLFGHCRGAFSSAHSHQKGLVEEAQGGTLFLDEVSSLKPELQPKLLRFLEDGSYRPVGESKPKRASVWVISASNESQDYLRDRNKFRNDLFYRLSSLQIDVPALRERGGDVGLLAEFFVHHICRTSTLQPKRFSDDCRQVFLRYDWPGNVRELKNVIARLVANSDEERICRNQLFSEFNSLAPKSILANKSLYEVEKHHIETTFKNCGYNIRETARILQIARNTLKAKLKKYNTQMVGV